MNDINRRTVLKGMAAGGAGLMLGTMPVFAQSSNKLVFMEPYDMALEYLHEMNAIVGGHFEKEGLTVEIASIRNTSAAIQQVVTGQAFVSRVGLLDVFKASEAQTEPVFSVGTSLQHGIFSVVSREGDPIRTPEDFKGKLVGLASIGGGNSSRQRPMSANRLVALRSCVSSSAASRVMATNSSERCVISGSGTTRQMAPMQRSSRSRTGDAMQAM